MTLQGFQPETLAREWSERVTLRMAEMGVPADEIEETRRIIASFTKTAAEELQRSPTIILPYTEVPFIIDPAQAHQIIDLFLRGVNYSAKQLRVGGKSWDERRGILEELAWKLFNLAKLLVSFLYMPNSGMEKLLASPKDLQLMMRQSSDVLLKQQMGQHSGMLPFDFPGLR